MNLSQYVDDLKRELMVAAEAGGDDARALAERLTGPLDSTARLVLLEALADAASEITSELAPGSVEVRLRGRDPEFVVTAPPADQPADVTDPRPASPAADSDDGGTARTTLRLPEQLKGRVEEAANGEGLSVNTWLVRAISAALEPTKRSSTLMGGQRLSGWVN